MDGVSDGVELVGMSDMSFCSCIGDGPTCGLHWGAGLGMRSVLGAGLVGVIDMCLVL